MAITRFQFLLRCVAITITGEDKVSEDVTGLHTRAENTGTHHAGQREQ